MRLAMISTRPFQNMRRAVCWTGTTLLCAAMLGGCATNGPLVGQHQNNLEVLLKDIDAEVAKGQRDRAIALLNQAAKENPTNMAPWLKMANIWFDAGNYPSSIVAANEVLQRDAGNQDAKSLLVVAGLRVAAGAVTGLRPNGAVGTSARMEAESLTNSLRGVLGEKVLVPAAEAKPASYTPRPKPKLNSAAPSGLPPLSPQNMRDSGSADPFKALK